MLSYWRYMVETGRKDISQVPEPYRSQLIAEMEGQ